MDAVDLVHANATGYGHAVTTIALVRGQALGGGFEAALSAHVLVAERGSKMGLPEVLFNMFPGMGAWQFLSRRVGPAEAERIILGGRTYRAEELHALGVVDVLAEEGEGEIAVARWIRSHDRQHHARAAFRRAVDAATPLDRSALQRMAEVWVETALGLGERDLTTIDYLVRAQQRMAMKIELERAPAELLKKAWAARPAPRRPSTDGRGGARAPAMEPRGPRRRRAAGVSLRSAPGCRRARGRTARSRPRCACARSRDCRARPSVRRPVRRGCR